MNIDIDITDPRDLARTRSKLLKWLKIVDFALLQYYGPSQPMREDAHPDGNGIQPDLGLARAAVSNFVDTDNQIELVIQSMKKHFTTSDIILGLGDKGKESRSRVKLALKHAEAEGTIRLVKAGKGRRPSEYERMAKVAA